MKYGEAVPHGIFCNVDGIRRSSKYYFLKVNTYLPSLGGFIKEWWDRERRAVHHFNLSGESIFYKTRLLTYEMMHRRGFNVEPICSICEEGAIESSMHLFYFFQCTTACRVWAGVNGMLGVRIMHIDETLQHTFLKSWVKARARGLCTKIWNVFFAAICW